MKIHRGTTRRNPRYSNPDVQSVDSPSPDRDLCQKLSTPANRRGRPRLIDRSRMEAVVRDLGAAPSQFGYPQPIWTGALLSRHIARVHGTRISARQCRRILQIVTGSRPTDQDSRSARNIADNPGVSSHSATVSAPRSRSYPSLYRQQVALARLRKLASSGLPLNQLVMAIFDIVGEAIPSSDQKALCTAVDGNLRSPNNWIRRGVIDEAKNSARYQYYVNDIPVDRSLIRNPVIADGRLLDEPTLPGFHRTETYNEYFRPIGEHHGIIIIARDGRLCVGAYPIWRSPKMPEFSADEIRFAKIAALHIGHALSNAHRRESRRVDGLEFSPADEGIRGMVLMRPDGRVLAIDESARSIFTRIAMFEGSALNPFVNDKIRPMLNYLTRSLGEIFNVRGDVASDLGPPSTCLYFYRTGTVLRLRGFVQEGDAGARYYNVMVEAGELAEHRRLRLMIRHGLSPREADLLRILAKNYRGREAAMAAGIAPTTLHKYIREMTDKLGIHGSASLRQFARQLRI